MTDTTLAQTIFSFFKKTHRLGEIPDFLVYARKHLSSFEPAVVVGVSEYVLGDLETQKLIREHIQKTLGTGKVSFEKHAGIVDEAVTLSQGQSTLTQTHTARLENSAITLLSFLTNEGLYARIPSILEDLQQLYTNYIEEIVVTIKTDTHYTSELEDSISSFCIAHTGAKRAIINHVVDPQQGGGFQVRWREFVYNGTYSKGLQGFK